VVDDMHELRSPDGLRQFELFLMRAPAELRFVLAARHDLRLGLHRLRLEGGLVELRAADLRFGVDEARELFDAAGIQVSGPLAEILTGGEGGEQVLLELERANAFVTSLDARRIWFRYHPLFAELLQLELRRAEPDKVPGLHAAAAGWYAGHGYPVEAIRHAQAAGDWALAGRLLSDRWVSLVFDGQEATAHELVAGFPPGVRAADPELGPLGAAAYELSLGSLDEAERLLALAAGTTASVPEDRRPHFQAKLAAARLWLARQRGDLPAAVEEAQRLLGVVEAQDAVRLEAGDDLRALAMVSLGVAERLSSRFEEAERHLSQGVTLARRAGRAYLEVDGLAAWAMAVAIGSFSQGAELAAQAVQLAEQHGWEREPAVTVAYLTLSAVALWRGRLDETEQWLARAGQAMRAEIQPGDALMLHYQRGFLELARGRNASALAVAEPAVRLAELVAEHHPAATKSRAVLLHALVRLGETGRAEAVLAALDDEERRRGETRCALAALRLTQGDPQAATAALAPVLDGTVAMISPAGWTVQPFLMEAIARDALGDTGACDAALERALDLAEPGGDVLPFLFHPAPALLERRLGCGTAHGPLVGKILDLLSGGKPGPADDRPVRLHERLSDSEARVLRYLPTNLSAPEISAELSVSVNTVRTHQRHLYEKLGAHSRSEAVDHARALGLLASPARRG
jgi:LuxR family maltose regulon positive regulatory protein